jgi:phenylalanyl-tRNA synthetase alpha chain
MPLGIKVPVIAWGLGIDRLFMIKARINDIRELFSHDLQWLRNKELM